MDTPGESTTRRDRYTLVPGMTAYRASQIFRRSTAALSLVWVVLGVGVGLFLGATSRRGGMTASEAVLLAGVLLVPALVIVAFVVFVSRRDRAEAAAGYTTQTSGRVAFDQVDPVTGVVIRRAHSAVLTLPSAEAGGPAEVGGPPEPALAPTTATYFAMPPNEGRGAAIVYTAAAVLFAVLLTALLLPVALSVPDGPGRSGVLIGLVAAIVGVPLLVAVSLGLGVLRTRGRIRRFATARPGETVFLSPKTPELRQALKAAGGATPHLGLGGAVVVSVGFDGIRLWKGSPDAEPRFTLTWDRVDHVQAGTLMVAAGKTRVPYRTAHVFQKGTPPIDLPLPLVNPRGQGTARAGYANDVLGSMARFTTVLPAQEPVLRKRAARQ
ncbi:hypothetical protein [Leifsonia sp. TF02-11]|uniref:hypothetical protein n=1 Tax=Leifsonia sp. TF02-11 TaxID=2815212 RepID=UPI001AA13CA4|nr:hypothetical protein [Leifsonia sp. TF02-11]MBO1741212.1 hypothetical protein [Leifsonia sp. TF02-11]